MQRKTKYEDFMKWLIIGFWGILLLSSLGIAFTIYAFIMLLDYISGISK